MTGRTKSVHFPLAAPGQESRASHPDRKSAEQESYPDRKGERQPSILIVGMIGRDHLVFGHELQSLHHDPSDYHSKLRVMFSALERMRVNVKRLIEEIEVS